MRWHLWQYSLICVVFLHFFNVVNADSRTKADGNLDTGSSINIKLPVQVCSETWAPFYYEVPHKPGVKEENKQTTSNVVGVNIDILEATATQHQFEFQYRLMPTKRCLHNSQKFGHETRFEITVDVTYSEEKAKEFYFVGPIYTLSRAIFYSEDEFPKGLFNPMSGGRLTTLREMKHFDVCEADGRVIKNYIEKHRHLDDEIISIHKSGLSSMILMLKHGRCEIMEIPAPIIAGSIAIGEITLPNNIACQPLNEDDVSFYFLISKRSPRAEQLVTAINQSLIRLKQSGLYDDIVKRYYDKLHAKNSRSITSCF
ncbi:transporter substrate-binding domain-containing protein [Vibrio penaeicida]|uniref:substrate-binding periplasmic protein n=1 Tax=Vibrio penaeicida TaxID=104609 RepID=UPI002734F28B|nr:transporter substrate-binding domain-containing protein [Vibrio penaeicida]MDP2573602.1 transporter substrate-binding domain-containing protein [Vibrio penaeicida]